MLDALGVTDVHVHTVKHRNLGEWIAGDLHAALVHQDRQSGCFERDRLAAGVRACDYERTEVGSG